MKIFDEILGIITALWLIDITGIVFQTNQISAILPFSIEFIKYLYLFNSVVLVTYLGYSLIKIEDNIGIFLNYSHTTTVESLFKNTIKFVGTFLTGLFPIAGFLLTTSFLFENKSISIKAITVIMLIFGYVFGLLSIKLNRTFLHRDQIENRIYEFEKSETITRSNDKSDHSRFSARVGDISISTQSREDKMRAHKLQIKPSPLKLFIMVLCIVLITREIIIEYFEVEKN